MLLYNLNCVGRDLTTMTNNHLHHQRHRHHLKHRHHHRRHHLHGVSALSILRSNYFTSSQQMPRTISPQHYDCQDPEQLSLRHLNFECVELSILPRHVVTNTYYQLSTYRPNASKPQQQLPMPTKLQTSPHPTCYQYST